jgi:hypothetical protein
MNCILGLNCAEESNRVRVVSVTFERCDGLRVVPNLSTTTLCSSLSRTTSAKWQRRSQHTPPNSWQGSIMAAQQACHHHNPCSSRLLLTMDLVPVMN